MSLGIGPRRNMTITVLNLIDGSIQKIPQGEKNKRVGEGKKKIKDRVRKNRNYQLRVTDTRNMLDNKRTRIRPRVQKKRSPVRAHSKRNTPGVQPLSRSNRKIKRTDSKILQKTSTDKPLVIVIPDYKIPSWNVLYSSKHWSVRSELAAVAHSLTHIALYTIHWTPYSEKVNILITAHLKREIDADNVCSKLLIDGLKLQGVIKDDTPKYVDKVSTRVVKDKKDYVIIEITPWTNG